MPAPTERRGGVLASGLRFVVAGGANTLVTGAALAVLAHFIDPRVAYAIVFALGLVVSTFLAGSFVFRVRMSRLQTVLYVLMYVVVFLIGLAVVAIAQRLGVPGAYSGLVVLVTAPLTFVGGWILLRRNDRSGNDLEAVS